MSSYSLTITLTPAQVNSFFNSKNQILLAKPTSAGGLPTVIWLALPALQNSRVTWTEDYGFYFSAGSFPAGSAPISGSTIIINSSLAAPVSQQALYTLGPNGHIAGPDTSQGSAGNYSLLNNYGSSVLVGLTQLATVNGQPSPSGIPMLADILMQSQTDTITPSPQVYIWAQSPGGTALAQAMVVTGGYTLLPFSNNNSTISVVYNSATGLFEPYSNT